MTLYPAQKRDPTPTVHDGHEWIYVLSGRLRLVLAEKDLSSSPARPRSSPAACRTRGAVDGPAEALAIFGLQGERIPRDDADATRTKPCLTASIGESLEPMPAQPPTTYDYAVAGVLRRQVRLLVTSRPVAWLSALLLPGLDRATFRLTRGRVTLSAWVTGLPVVQLTTIGARSGAPRTVRMLGIPASGGFIVIAANFGQTANPAWYHNLRARPQAWVVADGVTRKYRALELKGPERDRAFQLAVTLNPGWRRFQQRAAPRPIPVMQLTRAEADDP